MDTPLDVFHHLYEKARRAVMSEQAREERRKYLEEKQKLDEQYAYELKQRQAIEARRITLAMASSVSILMKVSEVQPEHWLYTEPIYEMQGRPRKQRKVQTGTRQRIALEGWPLDINQGFDQSFFSDRNVLVLTSDENINEHPPLVWYKEFGSIVTKEAVHPLDTTPLSTEDIPWIAPSKKSRSLYDLATHDNDFIRAEPNEEELKQLRATSDYTSAYGLRNAERLRALEQGRNNADYDTYRKVHAEQRIRRAIAQVAVKHNVLSR